MDSPRNSLYSVSTIRLSAQFVVLSQHNSFIRAIRCTQHNSLYSAQFVVLSAIRCTQSAQFVYPRNSLYSAQFVVLSAIRCTPRNSLYSAQFVVLSLIRCTKPQSLITRISKKPRMKVLNVQDKSWTPDLYSILVVIIL